MTDWQKRVTIGVCNFLSMAAGYIIKMITG